MNEELKLKRAEEKKLAKEIKAKVDEYTFIQNMEERFASKADIDKLTEAMTQIAKNVNELTQNQIKPNIELQPYQPDISGTADMNRVKEPTVTSITSKIEEMGGLNKMPIPPAWRNMVDDILGMDFGIDIVYPQSGSGFLFKLIVPAEKSNASQSYKEFYKVDIRTKAISYSDGIEGIRKFCELVKVNLSKK